MQRIVLFDVWRRCFKRERLKKMIEDEKECPDAEVAAMLDFANAYKSKKDAKGQAKKKSTHAELTRNRSKLRVLGHTEPIPLACRSVCSFRGLLDAV